MTTINELLTEKYKKCLDLFGGTGAMLSKDVRKHVEIMEIWDNNPDNEAKIHENCPDSTVKICNSYEEILKTRKRFDLVICDNPICDNKKIEHFAIFEHILRICSKNATIIIDIIPEKTELSQRRCNNNFNELHNRNRMKFYATSQPEKISINHMVDTYRAIIEEKGFKLIAFNSMPRQKGAYVHFLKLAICK